MASWLEQIDPGGHRRIKGLRLVAAYGLAAVLSTVLDRSYEISGSPWLSFLAAGFALWASVSEGQTTRWLSARDLAFLNAAAVVGALMFVGLSSLPIRLGLAGPEWILITGAFLVGYLRRFGSLGAGVGSQIYIGQLLAYGVNLTPQDLPIVLLSGLIAGISSVVAQVLRLQAEPHCPRPCMPRFPTVGSRWKCAWRCSPLLPLLSSSFLAASSTCNSQPGQSLRVPMSLLGPPLELQIAVVGVLLEP